MRGRNVRRTFFWVARASGLVLLSVGAALAWGIGTTDWAETAGWALGAWMVGMVFILFSALLSDSTSAGRGDYDWRDDDNPINGDINPATGLPMVGSWDVWGNAYGGSGIINPATGLPMIGGVDAGGNAYGFGDDWSDR
jgi:hypothetical protein